MVFCRLGDGLRKSEMAVLPAMWKMLDSIGKIKDTNRKA